MLAMAIAMGLFAASCNNEKKTAEEAHTTEGTHTHDDGTVHNADHTPVVSDTTKADTTHVHDESTPHTH